MGIEQMVGRTMVTATVNEEKSELEFTDKQGNRFKFHHEQDCCETVGIEDICGDLEDLLHSPILQAEETAKKNPPESTDWDDSETWTFYKFSTIKGGVTVRWLGSSNGYYSEGVDFVINQRSDIPWESDPLIEATP